jgi:hypothetical protein
VARREDIEGPPDKEKEKDMAQVFEYVAVRLEPVLGGVEPVEILATGQLLASGEPAARQRVVAQLARKDAKLDMALVEIKIRPF